MKYKNTFKIIALSLMIIFTMTACQQSNSQADGRKEVGVIEVKQEKEIETSEFPGTLQAMEEVTVSFEVPGKVKTIRVAEGSNVNAGDILADLDQESYRLQVNIADAGGNKASVAYQQVLGDCKRYEELYKAGAIALSQYETIKTQLAVAEQDMNSAAAAREQATLALTNTQLKAPISGAILSKYVTAGQLIGAGTPAYQIGNLKNLKAILPVPDYEVAKWKVGDKVTVKLYENTKEGTITKIFPSTSQGTGTVSVEVNVDNKQKDWLPGQIITCVHTVEAKDAIYVPVDAVLSKGNSEPYVFVANGDKAVKTPVKQGKLKGDKIEISSGLSLGDKVVVKGANRLFDHDTIKTIEG